MRGNIENLPYDLRQRYLQNAIGMHNFYAMSPSERDNILDAICKAKDELSGL